MRILVSLLIALALASASRAETVGPPPGCTALATLIYEDCSVAIVSSCEGMPPSNRVYEYYRDGKPSSRSVQEDGALTLAVAGPGLHRTFSFESGLLGRLLELGDGAEVQQEFTSETREGDSIELREGVLFARHKGFWTYPLGDTEVQVLRLEVDGETDDGTFVQTIRVMDLELGIMLALVGSEAPPDGPVRRFDHRAVSRLLPGDPGFGEVDDPLPGTCGAPS